MVSRGLCLAAIVLLAAGFGCGAKGPGERTDDNGDDPNAAVDPDCFGVKKVVYAADIEGFWDSARTAPGGEQWDSPPEGREYLKFTYHGDKLTKLETFGETGAPSRWLKAGVRVEWKYAAHGGVLEELGYDEDGELEEHNAWLYDERGRIIEETYGYGGGEILARTTYAYLGDGRDPQSGTTRDGNGNLLSKSRYVYSGDGLQRTETYEAYENGSRVTYTRTSRQRWNADRGTWEHVEE